MVDIAIVDTQTVDSETGTVEEPVVIVAVVATGTAVVLVAVDTVEMVVAVDTVAVAVAVADTVKASADT